MLKDIIVFVLIVLCIGTVGGMEQDVISMGNGMIRCFIFLAIAGVIQITRKEA